MSVIPKFYLVKRKDKEGVLKTKDCRIKMVLTIPKGRVEYYTRLSVDAKYFQEDYYEKNKNPIKSNAPYSDSINDKLKLMFNDASILANKIIATKEDVTPLQFKERLDEIFNPVLKQKKDSSKNLIRYIDQLIADRLSGKKVKPNGQPYQANSAKKLKDLVGALLRFCKKKRIKILTFEDVNDSFYNKFKQYIFEVENKRINTFGRYIKDIKMIMSEAKIDGFIENNPASSKKFISLKSEADTISLTKDQLDVLYNLKFNEETLSPEQRMILSNLDFEPHDLEKVRDLFLISCYSALRYSDLNMVSIESITPQFMRVFQKKTKQRVTIPVSSKLESILSKYKNKLPVLKYKGLASYNHWVRKIMELAGFTHDVTIKDSQGGKLTTTTVPFYSLVSSHTARRTYATIMFLSGVPTLLIMAVTGHKTEASFLKYIRATNEDKARLMAEHMEKIGF